MESLYLPHRSHDERPWGDFVQFTKNDPCTVKLLTVKSGQQFSLQTHEHRDEFWRILEGSGSITIGEEKNEGQSGDEFWIPRGTKHRAYAIEDTNLQILEISFGEFDENDIVRLEDNYGRVK